jgi:PST family polysaccharide transporter
MVTVFTGFAAMLVDAGLSTATIQRQRITHQQVSNLFWVATGTGFVIAVSVAALAPAISEFYGEPRLIAITLALCMSFIFSGLTIQHQALMRRAMRLKAISIIEIIAYVAAYSSAIVIAYLYHTYWAIVLIPITNAFIRMLATWIACGWRPSWPRREPEMRELLGFGANLTGFSIVDYFSRNADNMLIGWAWGADPLGLYERAYKLMLAPLSQVSSPLHHIVAPTLSRLRNEPARFREVYFLAAMLMQLVSCPLMAFVVVSAPWIVEIFFGPDWSEVAPILRWLAVAGFLQPLLKSHNWLYVSQDRAHTMFRWGLVGSLLMNASFVIGLPWGPLGVAMSYAIVTSLIVVPVANFFAGSEGHVNTKDLFRLTLSAVLYAIPAVLAPLLVTFAAPGLSAIAKLAISGLLAAVALSAVVLTTKNGRAYLKMLRDLLNHSLRRPQTIPLPTQPSEEMVHENR